MTAPEDSAHKNNPKSSESTEQIVCPVCKKKLPECDLPDKDSVIYDNVYFESGIKIMDSHVRIHCQFSHMHDEQENELDESHGLIAVISTHFDGKGECTLFEIVELLDQKGGE